MKNLYAFLFFTFLLSTLNPVFSQNLVHVQGDAVFYPQTELNPAQVHLTPAVTYSYGAVYVGTAQNLNNYIIYEFDLYLGDDDSGADGMVFMLHNDPRGQLAHGDVGMGLGYASSPNTSDWMRGVSSYVANSVAIEFDTYRNGAKNDPSQDHIAFVHSGNNDHSTYPSNYTQVLPNIEDRKFHRFYFEWNPIENNVKAYFDGILRLNIDIDIREIIGGNIAYIGFSATTGGLVNNHWVRDAGSPLPVEMLYFNAENDDENKFTHLNWVTATETNNNYFEVERSVDGLSFENIGRVYGAGNSNVLVGYDFFDYNQFYGIIYYRLKQVDFDGGYVYSDVAIVARNEIGLPSRLISVYQNDKTLYADLYFNSRGNVRTQLFNMNGVLVFEKEIFIEEGVVSLALNTDNIPNNTIILASFEHDASFSETKKVFIK